MDGTATLSEIRASFRTPLRLLLPKLRNSRHRWRAKSHQRQKQLKAATVKMRDLYASRDRWRQHAELLHDQHHQCQQRLEEAERRLQAA